MTQGGQPTNVVLSQELENGMRWYRKVKTSSIDKVLAEIAQSIKTMILLGALFCQTPSCLKLKISKCWLFTIGQNGQRLVAIEGLDKWINGSVIVNDVEIGGTSKFLWSN